MHKTEKDVLVEYLNLWNSKNFTIKIEARFWSKRKEGMQIATLFPMRIESIEIRIESIDDKIKVSQRMSTLPGRYVNWIQRWTAKEAGDTLKST